MHSITMRRAITGFVRLSFLLLFVAFAAASKAPAQVVAAASITVAPPLLPVYDQPPIPGPGYMWTPGYWAWDDGDYYWVPGTWAAPPEVGLLWTPGYWACDDAGIYAWNAGYWGPHVGFYGGVVYGFGYTGVGYAGGFWRGGVFSYNRTVNNFGGVHITNVYSKTVVVNNVTKNVSYNGGAGGLRTRPNQQEATAASERHVAATGAQTQHQHQAGTNRDLRASANGGHPAVAATSHAGHFQGAGVVSAHHGGGAGHTLSTGGAHSPVGLHSATGGPKGPGGSNPPKATNTSLNAGPGGHTGGTGPHPGRGGPGAGGPGHAGAAAVGGGVRPGGPPGGFRPGVGGGHGRPVGVAAVGGGVRPGGPPGGFRPGVGGPPGGFRPGVGGPPRVANFAKPAAARGPAPRAPHR